MGKQIIYKGRGAQINTANRFHIHNYADDYDVPPLEVEKKDLETEYVKVFPKTILNKVTSPDIPLPYSINPYQGCEHGCVYCYARNTHPYWGYSAGLDFEQKILVKYNAAELLEAEFKKKSWKTAPIMFSGNTDCYQPIEKKVQITRKLLEVFWKYRHPVGMITKNSLILRDLDILSDLAKEHLVKVSISITTLDDDLRRFLEPRTSTVNQRLKAVGELSQQGVPVNVMFAPIIPGLNEHELLEMAKTVSELGAYSMAYTMVRLNGDVAEIFEDWLHRSMPDRAQKVLNKIKSCHNGTLSDHRFGKRMRGEGNISDIINQQYQLSKRLYFKDRSAPPYNLDLHRDFKTPQLKLF